MANSEFSRAAGWQGAQLPPRSRGETGIVHLRGDNVLSISNSSLTSPLLIMRSGAVRMGKG